VEIIFHGHHAQVSERVRRRAELAATAVAARLKRAVDAIIRFESDGPMRRVEIVLRAPRHKMIVARGEGRYYGAALSAAINRLQKGVRKTKAKKRVAANRAQAA
jgi:ribosome-associated translation inhibitor RaiA